MAKRKKTENAEPGRHQVEPWAGMYACPECGCIDVEGTEWVKLNSSEFAGGDPPTEDYWCPACEVHYGRVAIFGDDGEAMFDNDGDDPKPWSRRTEAEVEKSQQDELARQHGPELLAACEAALPFVLQFYNAIDRGLRDEQRPVAEALRAAIAKAKGGK